MKFTKFGKALLISALSVGVVLSVTSCVQDYSVGYLYITGTVTSSSTGNGIISGYQIAHNTGKLAIIDGLPVASGGANPVRAVLTSGSQFIYVLNRGVSSNPAGSSICTTEFPCQNSNITVFAVGANGIITPQETFFTKGINPFRLIYDGSGSRLLVLDHDSKYNNLPSSATNPNPNCALALGKGVTTCGDVTVFSIDGNTGRLSLVTNAQVNSSTGASLTYFPVPANAVDFALSGSSVFTLSASASATQSYPYTGGDSVFPYAYSSSTGQLTVSQNSVYTPKDSSTASQSASGVAGDPAGNSITANGSYVYILDANAVTVGSHTYLSQILPFTVANGILTPETGGAIPGDDTFADPVALLVESKGNWIYVANQGNNANPLTSQSGISGYVLTSNPAFHLTTMAQSPFPSGAGPQCIVEDPTSQYVYTADFNSSTITGHLINTNTGQLTDLNAASSYVLTGQPTWCLMDGRTN